MYKIYNIFEKILNYDVVCIIKDFVDILNNKDKLIHCIDQVKYINNEHAYLLWAYYNHSLYYPPPIITKFMLNCNNDKIKLNKTNAQLTL
jgi:hypothetical protein